MIYNKENLIIILSENDEEINNCVLHNEEFQLFAFSSIHHPTSPESKILKCYLENYMHVLRILFLSPELAGG